MDRNELFQEIANKISSGEMTREEIITWLSPEQTAPQPSPVIPTEVKRTRFSVTTILYVLGVAVVTIGIFTFVSQIWDEIGSIGRIMVTLGLGLIMAGAGSVLLKQRPDNNIGSIFHVIGGLLIPGGAVVTLTEFSPGANPLWPLTITFGTIFAFYLLLNFVHKKAVLSFFSILNGTSFTYLLVAALLDVSSYYFAKDIFSYLTMTIGASYLILSYNFGQTYNKPLVRLLNFFGTFFILSAGFSRVYSSGAWQAIFFIIVFGMMYLATYTKSSAMLIISTCFLVGHIMYITGEYFADSLGWPITLVLLGFIIIGIGYASVTLNKKFIRQAQ